MRCGLGRSGYRLGRKLMTKSEKTKAFIIEKTAPVFNKKGYAGTSLTDLTTVTGLTKGALYGNFKNKDEIALAVYDYNIRRIKSNFLSEFNNNTAGPIEKLLMVPKFYKKYYHDISKHGGCPILNTAVEADDNQPLLRKKVNKTITAWKKILVDAMKEGIAAGEIKPNINPSKYACAFIALFEGGIMLSKATNDTSYLYESLNKMTDMINKELRK